MRNKDEEMRNHKLDSNHGRILLHGDLNEAVHTHTCRCLSSTHVGYGGKNRCGPSEPNSRTLLLRRGTPAPPPQFSCAIEWRKEEKCGRTKHFNRRKRKSHANPTFSFRCRAMVSNCCLPDNSLHH